MSKRFTDTEKWDRPWFRRLPPAYRWLWIYILDRCDIAGVWHVDMEMASFMIGERVDAAIALDFMGKQIQELDGGNKWLIVDFVRFQYGRLSQDCRPHAAAIEILRKHGLNPEGKGLSKGNLRVSNTLKDKDKDKDFLKIGKSRERERGRGLDFESVWASYPNKDGRKEALRHFLSSVKTDRDMSDIKKALENYLGSEKVIRGFVKDGSTWFNGWRDWINPTDAQMGKKRQEVAWDQMPSKIS